jgi:hypothetical protein
LKPSEAIAQATRLAAEPDPEARRDAIAAALMEAAEAMPWRAPMKAGWSIVGMNHYFCGDGRPRLYVAMARKGRAIKAEGPDEARVFADLAKQASEAVE